MTLVDLIGEDAAAGLTKGQQAVAARWRESQRRAERVRDARARAVEVRAANAVRQAAADRKARAAATRS